MTGHPSSLHTNSDAQRGTAALLHYVKMRQAAPLSGIGDSVHQIHTSTEFEAELRFSDLEAVADALSVPAVSTGEPVAWLSEYDGHTDATTDPDTVRIWRETLNRKITPLYAAPASGDVRAAVIEPRSQIKMARWLLQKRGMFKTSIDQIEEYQGETWLNALDDADELLTLALSQAPATDSATSEKNWNIFDAAMMMLEDVPGETMLERIAKLKEWYLQLQMGSRA